MSSWLDWLNTAPIAEIEAELQAEEERSKVTHVAQRCMRIVFERRARGEPFARFSDFANSRNVGRSSRRAMRNVLARHGFTPACRRCPVHCPGESDES
jgi:hypothetical protein